jgi:signal transduction histidine kinase
VSDYLIQDPASLRRILDSILLIEADLELPALLQHVIEEARWMTGARYGALALLNEDRSDLAEFITVGFEPGEEQRIGPGLTGGAIVSLLVADPHPLPAEGLSSLAVTSGFPSSHDPVRSILGVPIKLRDQFYGNIYLTDKVGSADFTEEDEAAVRALAMAAGIAIENVRLHGAQDGAVHDERDRLARDLHDTVIQQLFAVGLSLQSIAGAAGAADVTERLHHVIRDVDDTIRQLRSIIFAVGVTAYEETLRSRVVLLLNELRPVLRFDVHSFFDGQVDTVIAGDIAGHLLMTLREALTNVARHAEATVTTVHVSVAEGQCQLLVIDNGCGIDADNLGSGGLGLSNLRRRAEMLHGRFEFESPRTGGTVLTWRVPLVPAGQPAGPPGNGDAHWSD